MATLGDSARMLPGTRVVFVVAAAMMVYDRRRTYWLDVGDGTYRVSPTGYVAAPGVFSPTSLVSESGPMRGWRATSSPLLPRGPH